MAAKDLITSGNTVIGPSILINGKLTGDEDLTVRGRVEGELSLTKTLIVEPSGVVKANVSVKNAVVSGVVVGNIQATESVELTHEGRMVGDIRAPRVIIVDGASFRGRVDMGELPPGRSLPERSTPRTQLRPTVRSLPPPPPRPAAATPARAGNPVPPAPAKKPGGGMPGIVRSEAARPTPPAPPAPPVVAAGAKKKVVLKKKK
ncbi:MAG TPA: polymer-forming cytoskeletal protein [Myxococcaceae bacterium]|nr:polymer-forming cytoskeletal protein [Myxococcaceae bacterium]